METLRSQTQYIIDQLRTLSVSGRIAIALLLVVLLGGTHQMLRWAGEPQWRSLLDQPFTPGQIQRVQAEMALAGVKARVEGDRIYIQGGDEDRQRIMALLAQRGALPRDTSLGYDALIKNSNVFISNQEARWRQSRGLEAELSAVLRKFQGITDANVLIQVPEKRPLGSRAKTAASASVNVTIDEGESLDQKRVDAIANLVAGAVEGLLATDVNITDGAQIYRARDPQRGMASDLLERQRLEEDHYTKMIYSQLGHIRGLVANVRVKLRDVDEQTDDKVLGKREPLREMEDTEESSGGTSSAGPGVLANQNRSISDVGGGDSTSRTKTTIEYSENVNTRITRINKPAGFVDALSASINVPHTWLEHVYRRQKGVGDDKAVEFAELQKVADFELSRIQEQIRTLLNIDAGGHNEGRNVSVDWYYNIPEQIGAVPAMAASADYFAMLRDYGPQAGLAILVLGSIFMVLRIVKQAQVAMVASKHAGSGAEAAEDELELGSGFGPVGQAEGIGGAMIGHEVDAGLVRTQQIVEQISELVNEDSESAAGILQSWLVEGK